MMKSENGYRGTSKCDSLKLGLGLRERMKNESKILSHVFQSGKVDNDDSTMCTRAVA